MPVLTRTPLTTFIGYGPTPLASAPSKSAMALKPLARVASTKALCIGEIGAAQLPHRQRSVPAVQGRVAALAGLQAAERRQQVVVGPARQVPAGEVFAPRADRHRAVDRRAAAEDLAADRMDRVPDRPGWDW